jgi:nucleotide-binding universal stress UspA family protein
MTNQPTPRISCESRECSWEKPPEFKRLLVAVDGSEQSEYAAILAAQLAGQLDGQVVLVHVFAERQLFDPRMGFLDADIRATCIEAAEALLARLKTKLPDSLDTKTVLREGDPATEILKAAISYNADLIVMGTHARGRLAQVLLGSVARQVTQKATCPVLTISQAPTEPSANRTHAETAAVSV